MNVIKWTTVYKLQSITTENLGNRFTKKFTKRLKIIITLTGFDTSWQVSKSLLASVRE